MLIKIFVSLLAWFLVSVIFGLLVGRAISIMQEAPTQGFGSPAATDWGTAALNEQEEEESLVDSHAQMQEVS